MSLLEALQISLFGLGTVFLVLVTLSAAVSLESKIFDLFGKSKKAKDTTKIISQPESATVSNAIASPKSTAGQLKLIEVDERTAAMIMAIVSDESQIPLSELNFKYIKAID